MKLLDIKACDYYADKIGETPSLTQSVARTLLTKSAFHAWRQHPRLGNIPRDPSLAMEKGSVVHDLLLGGGSPVQVIEAKDYRTKDAQQQRGDAIAAGRSPILASAYVDCLDAAAAVRKQLDAYGIPLRGESEGVIAWNEELPDGRKVACRGRVDHWMAGVIIDLKTCANAHPAYLAKNYPERGYDIQAAAYQSGIEKMLGCDPPAFLNVFVEMEEPYLTVVAEPDAMMMALGKARWSKALRIWADCLESNNWPAYATQPVSLTPPRWAMTEIYS